MSLSPSAYIYIYIERERDGETEREREKERYIYIYRSRRYLISGGLLFYLLFELDDRLVDHLTLGVSHHSLEHHRCPREPHESHVINHRPHLKIQRLPG